METLKNFATGLLIVVILAVCAFGMILIAVALLETHDWLLWHRPNLVMPITYTVAGLTATVLVWWIGMQARKESAERPHNG